MTKKCSCGETIVFYQTKNGKWMPCNPGIKTVLDPMYLYNFFGLQVNHRSGKSDRDLTIEGISDVLELDTRQVRAALKKLKDVKLITISLEGKAEFPRYAVQCFRVYLPVVMEARKPDEIISNRLKRKTTNKERGESGYSVYHLYKIYRENLNADSEVPNDNGLS